jgi:hypothetical protein
MLQLDPNKRISAADALNHPYFHSDPLPCKSYELPHFSGDYHEYTVRKDRKEMQNKLNFEKKNSVSNGKTHDHKNEGIKQRPKQRGHHNSHGNSGNHYKGNHYKNNNHDKSFKTQDKSQGEGQLAGMKRMYQPANKPKEHEPKPKLFSDSLLNNSKHPVATPGLLSLVTSSATIAPNHPGGSLKASEKDPVSLLRESHRKPKKRDSKTEYKHHGRGTDE